MMNKLKILGIVLFTFSGIAVAQAQELQQAKKAIDAEQYEKAKTILKSFVQANPENGEATLLLGNMYLRQNVVDSAKLYFNKGVAARDNGKLNNIGLGQIELNAGNLAAAQSNVALATKGMKKKDTEAYIYIAQAYMNSDKPDYKNAIAVLEKAKAANSQDALVHLALGDAHYGNKDQNNAYVAYRTAVQLDPA